MFFVFFLKCHVSLPECVLYIWSSKPTLAIYDDIVAIFRPGPGGHLATKGRHTIQVEAQAFHLQRRPADGNADGTQGIVLEK